MYKQKAYFATKMKMGLIWLLNRWDMKSGDKRLYRHKYGTH